MSNTILSSNTNLLIIVPFWLLQILITTAHILLITFMTHFLATNFDSRIIVPTTTLLALTYILYFALTLRETLCYFHSTLTTLAYLRLQSLKIYISFLELALLGVLTVLDEKDDATEKLMLEIIGLTAISRVPFLFGPLLCWWLWDENEGTSLTTANGMSTPWRTPWLGSRDFGVFEGVGERAPLLIRIHPPEEAEEVV